MSDTAPCGLLGSIHLILSVFLRRLFVLTDFIIQIYRRYKVKHILIQPPVGDTALNRVLKIDFYLKNGFIVVSLTDIWKFLMPVLRENFPED